MHSLATSVALVNRAVRDRIEIRTFHFHLHAMHRDLRDHRRAFSVTRRNMGCQMRGIVSDAEQDA
jgi:hypothetical protein